MKTALVYPVPAEPGVYNDFLPFARRYVGTYLKFRPGVAHDFYYGVMNASNGEWISVIPPYRDIPNPGEIHVSTRGIDIGCAQLCARNLAEKRYDFAVFSTSRAYFHREGWLRRLVEARMKHGDGLYGATGSYEAPVGEPHKFPNPHIRTVLYGCNPAYLLQMPRVQDRMSAHHFEAGINNFHKWFLNRHMAVKMVTWDDELDIPQWRYPQNIFRRGDQSNILCWDKHSDNYAEATLQERQRLEHATG